MTVAAAAAAAAPQLARPAARRASLGRRRPGQLGHRYRRCCRYRGILFIAVVCLMPYYYSILFYVILLTFLRLYYIYHWW